MNEDKTQCSPKVNPNETWGSFHPHQCKRTAIIERVGRWYCKIHDPEYVAHKKDAIQSEKYNKESVLRATESIALSACITINVDNPRAVAESIEGMYKALTALRDLCNGYTEIDRETTGLYIDGILSKVKYKGEITE